ncbi:preprotein translocase subunit YajC [Chitinimonas sp. BJYL2]|uniref:preprotein translocase subunit YajC n=1 Tax=Chitinimonas sp. BJYL2 TaxID=2976696 RepID=UPI0022B3109D|nr:preprotein translocase subunit YajC [Chitinimonas sp. BJYL2]
MLITPVYAAAPAQSTGAELMSFLPMIIIFVLFYFLLIRPQQKKMKEQKAMIDALTKGDEVVTSGGIIGRIVKAGDHYLTIEVADGVEMVIQRGAVGAKLEKGTLKAQR